MKPLKSIILPLLALLLSSCNGMIYDHEGDCSYKVRFKYDYNLKWADAFPAEVTGVTLYILDSNGSIVKQIHEQGDALKADGYEMTIDDLNPGTYTLLAWAGDEELGSYPRTEATVRAELQRRLQRTIADDGTHHFSTEMDRLYYGILTNAVFSTGYQDVFTVPLIKDTNNIRIVLQHLSGKEIAADDFTYTIEDTNGHLDADNALIDPTTITYHPWLVSAGTTTFGSDATATTTTTTETAEATQTTYSAAVAEFTVGRLMAENATTSRLTIRRNSDSQTIVSIPLIDALLLVKGEYRNPSTGSSMGTPLSDQEYLDRQDDYSMTFFIDENNLWMNAYIYINSWKVVLQSVGL